MRVLEDAGLVKKERAGRVIRYRFDPAPLKDAAAWTEPAMLHRWFTPAGYALTEAEVGAWATPRCGAAASTLSPPRRPARF